ncbi:MAG: hypothetical protein M0P58_09495 [Bacteroidales bacterium]|jgi:hypothetical protein|nr:hypothetical protein [Bacteroidales bacterium]
MKNVITVMLILLFSGLYPVKAQTGATKRDNYINSGFYLKLGPVIPIGSYAEGQIAPALTSYKSTLYLPYQPAQIGAALDMGYLIYFGPAFANNHLRAGMDITFLNVWFNTTSSSETSNRWKNYYYNFGQKIGPLFTINPIDRLMVDISYKINANFAVYYGEWDDYTSSQYSNYGMDFFHQELSLGFRYRVMVLSFQYNFGSISYDNLKKERVDQTINADTFRILFGVKF